MRDVIQELAISAELAGKQLSKGAIGAMLEEFKEIDSRAICEAIRACRRELRYFPTIADIIDRAKPKAVTEDQLAMQVVGRIWDARKKFGSYRFDEATGYIGELGCQAIKWFGGWQEFCEQTSDQDNTSRAQMRELVKAAAASWRAGTTNQPIGLPEQPEHIKRIQQMYKPKQLGESK